MVVLGPWLIPPKLLKRAWEVFRDLNFERDMTLAQS